MTNKRCPKGSVSRSRRKSFYALFRNICLEWLGVQSEQNLTAKEQQILIVEWFLLLNPRNYGYSAPLYKYTEHIKPSPFVNGLTRHAWWFHFLFKVSLKAHKNTTKCYITLHFSVKPVSNVLVLKVWIQKSFIFYLRWLTSHCSPIIQSLIIFSH